MKNAVAFLATLSLFLLLLQSCSKNSQESFQAPAQPDQVIDATVASGQTYTFTAGTSGTLTVSRQALHYQLSRTTTDEKGSSIYNYTPKTGYHGSDEVTLMYSAAAAAPAQPASGCPSHNNSDMSGNTSIVIKFYVSN